MPVGRFVLCLHSHMPYVLSHGKSPHGTDWIHESAAECYLPILHALDRLHRDGIRPRWTINMTPILAEQLEDPTFQSGFADYCQEKIDAAIDDARRFEKEGELWMQGLAAMWQRHYTQALVEFKHQWGRSIIEGFRYFQDEGCIEVITCAATHGYLPLLGTEESVRAQVKLGVETYKKHFGRQPRGMWLPECAYRPAYEWKPPVGDGASFERAGVDAILAENGVEYFFVDSHMIRGGEPLGTYAGKFPQLAELFARSQKFFTPPPEQRSEYEPYRLTSGVAVFARDPQTTVKVWSGEHGYPGDPHYLEFHKQLYPGRHKYWRISEDKQDLGKKQPYDPWAAFERLSGHAADMAKTLKETLAAYRGASGHDGIVTSMYDTELFGHWWFEGPEFLCELGRHVAADPDLECVSASEVLDSGVVRGTITLPEGSWGEGGYHFVWLNDGNVWTWEKLLPAERRMRELSERLANGPAREIVIQAGRELLLAEASDWQFLISTFSARDYAEVRFDDHIDRFHRLADLAESVHAGGELSVADQTFIEECQSKDAPFADLDPSLWSPSRSPVGT
ncbi:MAG: DUF1957 domain-containing protein [Fimbriimonadaceae bacterium]|nr:DUF1957 domain-containing protein [Fimbriimonadaceae bacterium]